MSQPRHPRTHHDPRPPAHVRGEHVHGPSTDPSASFSVGAEERRHAPPATPRTPEPTASSAGTWAVALTAVAFVVVLVLVVVALT